MKMNEDKGEKDKLIQFWVLDSDEDFETMKAMFESGRFSWSLFIGHLAIEKLLKAYFVKVNSNHPPFIHNLLRLAEKSNLQLTENQKEQLLAITAFNLNTRYDDYKLSFRKQCTLEFTSHWIEKINLLRTWIKELIQS
jgi:HEPN domain-containing protein